MRGWRPWTTSEDAAIRELYHGGGLSDELRSRLPDRSDTSIYQRAHQLGLHTPRRGPNPWTNDEERLAVEKIAEVCRATGRTPIAVCHHIEWMVRRSKQKK